MADQQRFGQDRSKAGRRSSSEQPRGSSAGGPQRDRRIQRWRAETPNQRPTPRTDRDRPRPRDPQIPEEIHWGLLGKEARERLRGLSKEHAEAVGAHLAMVGLLLDENPELAYQHAQAAVRHAGRIDVVREAAGIAAYRTGRYAEALRELRTVRRLNGSSAHLPLMADAERGLGRPERALELAASSEAKSLDAAGQVELALVVSGARAELGEFEAALAALDRLPKQSGDLGLRVLAARAAVLEASGRTAESAALLAEANPDDLERAAGNLIDDVEVVVYDAFDEELANFEAAVDLDPEVTASPNEQDEPTAREELRA